MLTFYLTPEEWVKLIELYKVQLLVQKTSQN
jgi:hypothetical protein